MKDYDMELSNEKIIESIKDDSLKRNKKINKLISLINNIECGKIISVDGRWGCGKTVFLKQFQILNYKKIDGIQNIDEEEIKKYQENYVVYYYNAWQNDYHESPLLSLVYNLINDFPCEENQNASNKVEAPFNLKDAIKTITFDFIDIDKVKSFKDIAEKIYTIEEKKQALNNILNRIIPRNKKLVFIIDELDRCNPDYAVKLLEIVKHMCLNDRTIFIVGTNNEQLSYTISNYYGANFDGYGYLTKFYNLIIELDDISPKFYLNAMYNIRKASNWIEDSIVAICEFFNFQMRDINRIISDFDLLDEYFSTYRGGIYREDDILKYVFLPYGLGLKIKSKKLLDEFLQGNGYIELKSYVKSSKQVLNIVMYDLNNSYNKANEIEEITEDNIFDHLETKYNQYFNNKNNNDWNSREAKKSFLDVFTLLSDYIKF